MSVLRNHVAGKDDCSNQSQNNNSRDDNETSVACSTILQKFHVLVKLLFNLEFWLSFWLSFWTAISVLDSRWATRFLLASWSVTTDDNLDVWCKLCSAWVDDSVRRASNSIWRNVIGCYSWAWRSYWAGSWGRSRWCRRRTWRWSIGCSHLCIIAYCLSNDNRSIARSRYCSTTHNWNCGWWSCSSRSCWWRLRNLNIKNWCSHVQWIGGKGLGLSSWNLSQNHWVCSTDLIVDNKRALVNTDYLDGRSMNSKTSSNSVHEWSCSTIWEESIESPLHSNKTLNGISWYDLELTTCDEMELKDVLDTNVSVFSAEGLGDWTIHLGSVVPDIWLNGFVVLGNGPRFSSWVCNSDRQRGCVIVGVKSKPEFLSRWTCEGDIVKSSISIDESWESTQSNLTSIEAIPGVIHVRVKLVSLSGTIKTNEYRLHSSVLGVIVHTFKDHDTEWVTLANVSVPSWFSLAGVKVWRQTGVVGNDLEIWTVVQQRSSAVFCVDEWEKNIQWTRAWESSTILKVGPFLRWSHDVG